MISSVPMIPGNWYLVDTSSPQWIKGALVAPASPVEEALMFTDSYDEAYYSKNKFCGTDKVRVICRLIKCYSKD